MASLPVVEIFGPTLQGEGVTAGLKTMFIRFGFCDGAGGDAGWCKWCDSLFAVDPKNKSQWTTLNESEIVADLVRKSHGCREVTLSGGNPAIHDLTDLVNKLHYMGYSINVETQGTIYRPWLARLDCITVSPKPPSAGNDPELGVERLGYFLDSLRQDLDHVVQSYDPPVCIKVPVRFDDKADYRYARDIFNMAATKTLWMRPYLSIVTDPEDTAESLLFKYKTLAQRVCDDHKFPDVQVLPQLHVLMWEHARGV